ncbi:MAG: MFS transporter [Pseudomonadota bacterium]
MANNRSVVAINLSVFLLMIGVGLIVALLPRRIMDLSSSVSAVGFLAGAYAIPNVLLQIPLGRLSDRIGFKAFIVGGYGLCGLAGLLYFCAEAPGMYFLGRFVQGLAEVPILALAPALLSLQYAREKGRMMGLYNASLHCGLTLGGLLSIAVADQAQGGGPFLMFAALSLGGGLITALFVQDHMPDPAAAAAVRPGTWALPANRANLVVLAGIALYGAGYGIFITIVPAFLIGSAAAATWLVGVYFTLYYVAASLAQFFAGAWSDRKGRKTVMVFGLLPAAAGLATFHGCRSTTATLALLTLAGLGLGAFCVASLAFLNDRAGPGQKGAVSGAYFFVWGMGYFVGPLLLGRAGSSLGLPWGFTLFAGLIALELVAILLWVREGRAEGPTR